MKKCRTTSSSDMQFSKMEVSKHFHCGCFLGALGKDLIKVFASVYETIFYSEINHSLEQPPQEHERVPIIRGSFLQLDRVLDNLIRAAFHTKGWTRQSFDIPWLLCGSMKLYVLVKRCTPEMHKVEMHLLMDSTSRISPMTSAVYYICE